MSQLSRIQVTKISDMNRCRRMTYVIGISFNFHFTKFSSNILVKLIKEMLLESKDSYINLK